MEETTIRPRRPRAAKKPPAVVEPPAKATKKAAPKATKKAAPKAPNKAAPRNAANAAPVKAAAKAAPKKAIPLKEPVIEVVAPIPAPAPAPVRERPIPVWARVVADPGYAPEHIVRNAVARLGPQAGEWVARTKDRYPDASPDGLARLAAQEYRTAARRQGMAIGSAGFLGSLALTGTLAQAQTRLVLTIAAVYGEDPTASERVDELLELLRVPRLTEPAMAATGHAAKTAGSFAVRRIAARLVPFGGAIAGALLGSRGTEDVAARAMQLYRQRRNPSRLRSRV
jgi:hypothetical protein